MSKDPYKDKLFKAASPYASKTPVTGRLVCVLNAVMEERGLELCPYPSRAVLKNEIHELILTDEVTARPTQTVNRIAYLGFFEVLEGGILLEGDLLQINEKTIGALAGFDFTHLPNHMNLVIKTSDALKTGTELVLQCGDPVSFTFVPQSAV